MCVRRIPNHESSVGSLPTAMVGIWRFSEMENERSNVSRLHRYHIKKNPFGQRNYFAFIANENKLCLKKVFNDDMNEKSYPQFMRLINRLSTV